jgi:two-component system phosphate regulon sensor histidine kinase PhoR
MVAVVYGVGLGVWLPRAILPRLAILAVGVLPVAVLAARWLRRPARRLEAARRHLETLCRLEPHELASAAWEPQLPAGGGDGWSATVAELGRAMQEHGRAIEDLQQTRDDLEIRCRRAVQQADQIKGILAALPEPLMVIDNFGELVLVNPSAERLFPAAAGAVQRRVASLLGHCQRLVDLLAAASQHKAASRSEEIEITDCEGQSHCYRATVSRLRAAKADAADAAPAGTVVLLRDIADRKAIQKQNAQFVSSVSHEMKAPLAGIKAYVELLADGDVEDEQTQEEFLGVIGGQADRLQRLVENLLNLARIEAGVVKVGKEPRSLNAILEQALGVVRPAAEAKNIALSADLSPMYLGVLADGDMLLQAAINLLSNAIKYTPQGGRVTLRSRMQEEAVRFEVQDTGVGLSPEDCQRVFEKFYRVNKSKDLAAGTGLGLPLAKHIVEDVHNGQLGVESVLGQGSTFHVTLPSAGQMTLGKRS